MEYNFDAFYKDSDGVLHHVDVLEVNIHTEMVRISYSEGLNPSHMVGKGGWVRRADIYKRSEILPGIVKPIDRVFVSLSKKIKSKKIKKLLVKIFVELRDNYGTNW